MISTASTANANPMNEIRDQENSAEHMLSPIILDLDGNGITTTTVNEGAFFDHDLDGKHELTAWVGGNDGLLVYDKNNDGVINNGNEVFGDHYELSGGGYAANGFAALAEFDSNSDGKIDAADANFTQLQILTGDGQVDDLHYLTYIKEAA